MRLYLLVVLCAVIVIKREVAGKNWTDFGRELMCGIAPRMVENQGDRNGEHTEEAYSGV